MYVNYRLKVSMYSLYVSYIEGPTTYKRPPKIFLLLFKQSNHSSETEIYIILISRSIFY